MFNVIDGRTIELTRGDMMPLTLSPTNKDETPYEFKVGDIVRITVHEKNKVQNIMIQKDFEVKESCTEFDIELTAEETKIGDYISKPVDYWYEIEINPDTPYVNTIVGYDRTLGPAVFWLLPEGGKINAQN